MKIYSDTITTVDIWRAFKDARDVHGQDIYLDGGIRAFTPRAGGYGYEIFAESLHGKRASAHGPIGADPKWQPRAASWEAYGYVIAYLYNIDAAARIGWYKSAEDFRSQTSSAYQRNADDFLATLRTA